MGVCKLNILSITYKIILGRLLGWGIFINRFSYPSGYSPVPTPARYYIDLFLERYQSEIRGSCVEFVPPYYKERYISRKEIQSYDVWDVQQGAGATIVGDLQAAPQLDSNLFDCIILTHVLCNIAKPWLAVEEILRLLKPGGVVLCTVPMVLQGHAPHPQDYWRFTPDTMKILFEKFSKLEVHSFGNAATAAGSPQFLMKWHFSNRVLNHHDSKCPSIVACAAWK